MKQIFILLIFYFTLLSVVNAQTVINYTASTKHILNPGRGFYAHAEYGWTTTGASNTTLTNTYLQTLRNTDSISIILRLYYLGEFKASAISAAALTIMQNDMAALRSNGMKCIIRFAYGKTIQTHNHADDASRNQVLVHLNQLKSFFQTNSDVILTVQTGFIGTFGEWFYTHPDFSLPDGNPDYPFRKSVSDSLLKVLPLGKQIQIRTPYYKFNSAMYGTGASGTAQALTLAQAYDGTPKSRIGHHNDCFLANSTDYGTYLDLVNDKNYLEQDTKYTFNGGETCNQDATYTNCTNAQAEMGRFHYSYLNRDYNTLVLDYWKTNGCYSNIRKNLGYRLELLDGTYTNTASGSYTFNVNINLRNVGYAAPYEQKKFQLILKNNSTSIEYPITLNGIDNRFWLPGTNYNITTTVGIGTLANGSYNLYLAMKDTGVNITNNGKYSIQFANTGTWEDATGYNLLKVVTVNNGVNPGTGIYSGSNWFGPAIILPINFTTLQIKEFNENAQINWGVTSNNIYTKFEIERSENGINFNFIGSLLPNQSNNFNYTYIDPIKLVNNLTYYKLKFYKQDGTFEYSTVLKIKKGENATAFGNIFPLPAKDNISIEILNAKKDNNAIMQIIDLNGKLICSKKITLIDGYNLVNNVEISKIIPGIYTIKVINHDFTFVKKLIK